MRINVKVLPEVSPGALEPIVLDAAAAGECPSRVLIVPWGEVRSSHGVFLLDEEAVAETLSAFAAHGTDLPIDYEHQSLGGTYSSPNGQAPAAGWIKALRARAPGGGEDGYDLGAPGLWADVEWTAQAREHLRSKQYRYLSPVALVRRQDRRMVGLHSAALTNKPAIVQMQPVVNRADPLEPGWEALRRVLGLEETVGEDRLAAEAVERIRALESMIDRRRAADRVAAAMAEGKLTAAQRKWAAELALRDPTGFEDWFRHAPVVVTPGRTLPPTAPNSDRGAPYLIRRAREEYRSGGRFLAAICSEDAFIQDALREASGR